jgi:hypothetical protein
MGAGMPVITLEERYGNSWTFYAAQNCQTELENQIYVGATTQNSSTALTQLRYKWIKQFAPVAGVSLQHTADIACAYTDLVCSNNRTWSV